MEVMFADGSVGGWGRTCCANSDGRPTYGVTDMFDFNRLQNPHLPLGQGPHLCVGATRSRLKLGSAFPPPFVRPEDLALAIAAEDVVYTLS
ncbi:UNVERIFIED_ORG: cytochrome P450 [Rhizobium aethiopicum]